VTPFRTDDLVLLCPKKHPLARLRRTESAACLSYDFVGLNRGSSLLELTLRAAEQAGMPMNRRDVPHDRREPI
jgi:DNA-binding transcriptional LysR family regulator